MACGSILIDARIGTTHTQIHIESTMKIGKTYYCCSIQRKIVQNRCFDCVSWEKRDVVLYNNKPLLPKDKWK